MSSAICFNLDQSKILSSVNWYKDKREVIPICLIALSERILAKPEISI